MNARVARIAKAVLLATLVVLGQSLSLVCLLVLFMLGAIISIRLSAPVLAIGTPFALGIGPVVAHTLMSRRWEPVASLRRTVLLALIGSAIGYLVGAIFFESGHLRGGQFGSVAGTFVGALVFVTLGGLWRSSSSLPYLGRSR